jgi:hypothetical protein
VRRAANVPQLTDDDKQIKSLQEKLVAIVPSSVGLAEEEAAPLLCELQELMNKQGRKGALGFTKFIRDKLWIAVSTAYTWINRHKSKMGLKPAGTGRPFSKRGKSGKRAKLPEPQYKDADLKKFSDTPYPRLTWIFSSQHKEQIEQMCDDEDLRAFLKATDRYDCAHKAVQFAYDTAKNQARTDGAGVGKEKRPPDVRDGLLPCA